MSLSQLDLNLLLVLDTVLAERSVAKAARRLHVTPSAISNSLARLRSALGDPLVIRSGRGIVPTARAMAIAPLLRGAMADLERSVFDQGFDAKTTNRRFTLALADAGHVSILPALYRAMGAEFPRAQLCIVGIDTYLSSGGAAGTAVDVALIAVADRGPGIHQLPLYDEQSVLVGRRNRLRDGRRLSAAELSKLRHVEVQVAPGRGYRKLGETYAKLGIHREVAVIVPSFVAAAALVSDTDLVATLPSSLVSRVGDRLKLSILQSPVPPVSLQIKLVWHERTHADPAMQAFRDVLVKSMRASRS